MITKGGNEMAKNCPNCGVSPGQLHKKKLGFPICIFETCPNCHSKLAICNCRLGEVSPRDWISDVDFEWPEEGRIAIKDLPLSWFPPENLRIPWNG